MRLPRLAFFPDSFHEVNGVAHTARHFQAFAETHGLPMLCVRAALPNTPVTAEEVFTESPADGVRTLELRRSRLAVGLERDLAFDPLFMRHLPSVKRALAAFRPEVIHITGPSELGILGAIFAWRLKVPLVASWHTNLHEYAGRRLRRSAIRLHSSETSADRLAARTEELTLEACARFYRLAKVLYAPNPMLCDLLERRAGRPTHLMERGVDTDLFTPARRTRSPEDRTLRLGYVGRISTEKNVILLPAVDVQLRAMGVEPTWTIVGHGDEEPLLRERLGAAAHFTGVLRGQALAAAYADMDLLVFPSLTDTFGNVVLEALGAGVPAIVTPSGGPAHILSRCEREQGEPAGRIAQGTGSGAGFAAAIASFANAPEALAAARATARRFALSCSWNSVFERVISAYPTGR